MERSYSGPSRVKVQFGKSAKYFQVNPVPYPHILVSKSGKKIHGWWPGKRECTGERLLLNPYNGCIHDCAFCYAHAFWGYFKLYSSTHAVTVFKDFDKHVSEQLDSLVVASPGYLSPVTDPFQPINKVYRLSEKIIGAFVDRNLPIEFISKGEIPRDVLNTIKRQRHSFGQISILTTDEQLRKVLVPNGAATDVLFDNLKQLAARRIHAVCRIDPIIPLITDSEKNLSELIRHAAFSGANHIVASCMDIPKMTKSKIIGALSKTNPQVKGYYSRLYCEEIDGYLHASISYRRRLFSKLRKLCDKRGMSFALCMEYEMDDGQPVGLNAEFMSSTNCEGIDIPIYVRMGDRFVPACECRGDCLNCMTPLCGIPDLAMAKTKGKKDWQLKDYRRWGKGLRSGS